MDIPGNTPELLAKNTPHSQPLIISPIDHPITIEMIDRDALYVLRKLNRAGFSSYLVGGGVRDLYLDKTPKDFDISTDAKPGQIRKLFPNSNTIGRRFRLVQIFFRNGKVIEVSTLRSMSEHDLDGPEAVLAPNNTFGNLSEDAQRRDLSINSLFYEIESKTIIDYVGGVKDLDNSTIRIVGDPDKRINRDPVRMMRAIRHSARNNFCIEEKSWLAICRNHQKLTLCPISRLRDELLKDLYSGAAAQWFPLAVDSAIFFCLFPLYKRRLYQSSSSKLSYREQLANILSVVDRTNLRLVQNRITRPPHSFILALILIPWANAKYNLDKLQLKGPAAFQFSKKLRNDIDQNLGIQLNLRKSLRQDMTTLLFNLPLFVQHGHSGQWPKWLRKKSYFKKCALFHAYYREAFMGIPIPEKSLNTHPKASLEEEGTRKKEQYHKRKTKPAFSPRKRGGVFGFKK